MASNKYVCDFEQVTKAANEIKEAGEAMRAAVDGYLSKVSDDLTGWKGDAKNAFDQTNGEQVNVANQNSSDVEELGDFILDACNKIQKLETDLSGMKI